MKSQVQSAIDEQFVLQITQEDLTQGFSRTRFNYHNLGTGPKWAYLYSQVEESLPNCHADFEALRGNYPEIEGVRVVTISMLSEDMRGQGFGFEMYEQALLHAAENKQALAPDYCVGGETSESALKVWAALKRKYAHVGNVVWGGQLL